MSSLYKIIQNMILLLCRQYKQYMSSQTMIYNNIDLIL